MNLRIHLSLLVILFCLTNPTFASEKLIFALDLVRHGDRTPITALPKSSYAWQGLGQLTPEGKAQAIALGEKLRQKYILQYQLLPAKFDPKLLYVRSTNSNRTIETAQAIWQGLYPKTQSTIDIGAKHIDFLVLAKPGQSVNSYLNHYFSERQNWQQNSKGLQDKITKWAKATGMSLASTTEFRRMADNIKVSMFHHVPMPSGISPQDVKEIIALSDKFMMEEYQSKQLTLQTGKAILQVVNDYINQVKQHKTKLKYVLMTTHDSTIMSVMTTLGSPLKTPPPYLSDINFSLFKNGNKYVLKLSYNNIAIHDIK